MKTVKKQCEEIINRPVTGHPSRIEEERLRRLEELILKLAQKIDDIEYYVIIDWSKL